jgi:hypothetical protein
MKALRSLLGFAIIAAGIYLAWMVIPPYFKAYQLEDTIEQEARLNSYTSKSEEDIKTAVFRKAQELELPIRSEQIKVQRMGGTVSIDVEYTVHVDLPFYPLDLRFNPSSKNRAI